MHIIENESDFNSFIKECAGQTSLVMPVFCDAHKHPAQNPLCLVGVCLVESKTLVGIPFNHPESVNLPISAVSELTKGLKVWTPDKKALLFLSESGFHKAKDVQALEYAVSASVTDPSQFYPTTIRHLHELHYHRLNVNRAIPLYKWMEYFDACAAHACSLIERHQAVTADPGFLFVNIALSTLKTIEANGLHVDGEAFKKYFSKALIEPDVNGLVYSQYNLYTAAGRPSCRFGGINFAALNKDDGSREVFTSRFKGGALVLIDFESYHVRLIADLLNYTLPTTSAHEYFGRQYFKTNTLTPEQYEKSKVETFHNLYSEIDTDIPFFRNVNAFKRTMWDEIQAKGVITSPLVKKRIMLDHIWEPSAAKVFNYYVQFMETERNMILLAMLERLFAGKQSKIILYNYDSVLLDYSTADGRELLTEAVALMEQGGRFPVRVKYGKTFGTMEKLTL